MRLYARAMVALALLASPSIGSAETILGDPLEPLGVNARVTAAIAARFSDSAPLVFKDLKPSRARSGTGYCGQVARARGAPFVPFQVILDADDKAFVLMLSDAEGADASISKENATLLLKNAGCLE